MRRSGLHTRRDIAHRQRISGAAPPLRRSQRLQQRWQQQHSLHPDSMSDHGSDPDDPSKRRQGVGDESSKASLLPMSQASGASEDDNISRPNTPGLQPSLPDADTSGRGDDDSLDGSHSNGHLSDDQTARLPLRRGSRDVEPSGAEGVSSLDAPRPQHSSSLPPVAVRLSVQAAPDSAPEPVELWFYRSPSDTSVPTLRIHAHSQTRITHQHAPSPTSSKHRLDNESGSPRPTKHRKHSPGSLGSHGSREPNSNDGHRSGIDSELGNNPGSDQDEAEVDAQQGNTPRDPNNQAFVVDLGLVKAYPNLEDDSGGPQTEDVQNEDAISPQPSIRVMRIAAVGVIVLVILIPGLVVLILILNTYTPKVHPSTTAPKVHLQPLTWFEDAISLEVGIMSMSRIMLFGEASLEEPPWQCQPGLRPSAGYLHPNETVDLPFFNPPPAPTWFSNSSMFPRYKPWETTSTGVFVPEDYFLEDLQRVTSLLALDLASLADHGPLSFRFVRENSTQFRWSTSAGRFISPHDTLPTHSRNVSTIIRPGSTIPGFPPVSPGASESPQPTSRPEKVEWIGNLEPSLEQLRHDINRALFVFAAFQRCHIPLLTNWYPDLPIVHASKSLDAIDLMRCQRYVNSNWKDWGSDQARIDCLGGQRQVLSTNSTGPSNMTSRAMPWETAIPPGIPRSFIDQYRQSQEMRESRSQRYDASVSSKSSASASSASKFSPPSCTFAPPPQVSEWSSLQSTNQTAHNLIKILQGVIEYDGSPAPPGERTISSIYRVTIKYKKALVKLCEVMHDLNDRVQQVVQAVPAQESVSPSFDQFQRRTGPALDRLHDVAHFLDEIATVRLDEMRKRAEQGVKLLLETERRQMYLRQQVEEVIESGWASPIGDGNSTGEMAYLHFPSLDEILAQWTSAHQWLKRESKSIDQVFTARESEFNERRRQDDPQQVYVVWSRWDMRDMRRDPEGSESLCWNLGVVAPSDSRSRWWFWGKKPSVAYSKCGDASGRHGYDPAL